ncbi:MAG: NAD-dependent epimerase/dehydratase family protein, partial [Actinomycetota bacterium]
FRARPLMAERAFITGGTGLLGSAILEHLVEEGREVSALCRSEESRSKLEGLGATPIVSHLLDPEGLEKAMVGCDVVYHAAGLNAFCLKNRSPLFEVNVQGSLNVVEAALRAGVRRVVYTSSAATIGEKSGTVGREDSMHRGWFLSEYERSKYEAERAVLDLARSRDLDLVCVNPSSAQGPGRAGGTAKIIVYYVTGRLKYFVNTRFSIVDIVDCSRGHLLAEQRGRSWNRYVLNSGTISAIDALGLMARITGVKYVPRFIPGRLAIGAAGAAANVYRLRGRTPPVCSEMVRTLVHGHAYDGTRAARELGLEYTSIEDTLERTVRWLIDEGEVPPPPSYTGELEPRD